MSPVARSRQAHGFSTKKKKKKKITENQKIEPITSVAEKSNRWQRNQTPMPNIAYTEQISKSKSNSTGNSKPNTERQRCLSKKKKKSPIHNSKPNPSKPNPVTHHDHVTATPQLTRARRCRRRSPLIADRRSQIALPLLWCSLRPSLKVFLSFSLSLSLK